MLDGSTVQSDNMPVLKVKLEFGVTIQGNALDRLLLSQRQTLTFTRPSKPK